MLFKKGDWVRVAKDLGPSMSHFTADCEAIVVGSYADQYGGRNRNSYTLHLKGQGQVSWYYGEQLTLIESGRIDKLAAWEEERAADIKQKSDLDWIFDHGPEVAAKPPGASIQALASCFGLNNLWGSRGEGIDWYANAMGTMELAGPFLTAKDKAGWLALCQTVTPG